MSHDPASPVVAATTNGASRTANSSDELRSSVDKAQSLSATALGVTFILGS
jgi:hypothetical protein